MPGRRTRTTCMARSIAASHARCKFRMIESCLVISSNRLRGSAAYSSRTRRTQRSMMAALLRMTSFAIDRPLTAGLLDDRLALLVEAGIGGVGIVIEALGLGGVEDSEGGSLRNHLHAHDRGRRTQVDEIDIAFESHRQVLLQIET